MTSNEAGNKAKSAYIAYMTEKGFPPKNATQLLKFSKFHNPLFIGINYKSAKYVINHPPVSSENNDDTQQPNPYLDDTVSHNFVSPKDNEAFMQKHQQTATKSKVATAYDLYKEKKGSYPKTASQLKAFCKSNNIINIAYSECSQYLISKNKTQTKPVKNVDISKTNTDSNSELQIKLHRRLTMEYDASKFDGIEKPIVCSQSKKQERVVIDYSGRKVDKLEKDICKPNVKEESSIDYSGRDKIANLERDVVTTVNKQLFIKTSAIKKTRYSQFPTLKDYTNNSNTNNTEAVQLTNEILSQKPSGDPANHDTLFHILNASANNNGKKCLFVDSSKNIKSLIGENSYLNTIDGNDEDSAKFVLTLKTLDSVVDDEKYDKTDKIIELKQSLTDNTYNATVESIRERLGEAHGVDPKRILIKDVYLNGFGVAYTVRDLTNNEKNRIITQTKSIENKMKKLFDDYEKCAIHPALFQNTYDISMFDKLGNKTFGASEKGKYKVGPPGKEREYVQPTGWTRYGLKVLGKYDDDKWLTPFQDAGNWYRAFHGTSREAGSSIYNGAFRSGGNNAYGKGIYCTPDVNIAASYCASRGGTIKLNTKKGVKEFYFVFQVAVNPDTMNNPAYIPNFNSACESCKYWIAPTGVDIRPYGILIKEV